jgi:hypothetical protein
MAIETRKNAFEILSRMILLPPLFRLSRRNNDGPKSRYAGSNRQTAFAGCEVVHSEGEGRNPCYAGVGCRRPLSRSALGMRRTP